MHPIRGVTVHTILVADLAAILIRLIKNVLHEWECPQRTLQTKDKA